MRLAFPLGSILKISTRIGHAYSQYVYDDPQMGQLLRVLPGAFFERPPSVEDLASARELYFTYLPAKAAVRRGLLEVVGTAPVPPGLRLPPVMRRAGGIAAGGTVLNWWIGVPGNERRVDTLSADEKKLSIYAIWNDTMLRERVESHWTPEHEA